ncbi:MAG: RNase adapter RapZ [Bacteroidota bacterium]
MSDIRKKLAELYKILSGELPVSVTKLAGSGSNRTYYRIQGVNGTVIGAHNDDLNENRAFISFTNHFRLLGLPVPQILAVDPAKRIYLISDLGDMSLFQLLTLKRAAGASPLQTNLKSDFENHESPDGAADKYNFPEDIIEIYKKALRWLTIFQVKANRDLDYSVCYPRAAFDRQSMMWDLNYFKYYFLKLANIKFDEQELEDDFSKLCDLLLEAGSEFFLFRDFQSRNIMVVDNEPWFIDYQGGRKGALQYDVASLLYDAKADIPDPVREMLLNYYLDKLEEIYPVDREKFLKTYYAFLLIRIMQALGAYGFRGYYEKKPHFLQSIPYALTNLRVLRENKMIGFGLKNLMSVIDRMVETPGLLSQQFTEINRGTDNINELKVSSISGLSENKLTVTIKSFSYKKQIPVDESGNGGGYIFDCRALPNPGRFDEFKKISGNDQPVIDFLKKESAVDEFMQNTFSLVDQSVRAYIDRGFQHLMVSYGCTGGQHRSVYCAAELAKHLKTNFNISVNLIHSENLTSK